MTPRINPKPLMQNAAPSGTSNSPSNPAPPAPQGTAYSPSVPISIYRQVTTELQSAQTSMSALSAHNQQLVEQNQQLRLEIERVVQSALQLRQVADGYKPLQPTVEGDRPSDLELHFGPPAVNAIEPRPQRPHPEPLGSAKPIIEQESQGRRSTAADRHQEVGGWWLVLIILLIVVTAFGTGFLIVRPLLPNR